MDDISKYLIPLDELDMSLLLLDNVCLKTEQQTIRKTNYIDKRYSDESGVDTKDSDMYADVGFLTKRCSICEIEVPKEYMKNHIESDKHKMYLYITNTAINRCKKQIKENYFNPYKYEESSFFCETCVTVISIGNKSEHLTTESHQYAVKKDLKMKKLIHFYNNISDENPELENQEMNETKNKEEIDKTIVPKTFDKILAIKGEHLVIEIDNYLIKMLMNSYNGIMLTAKHRYKCVYCNDTFKKKTKHLNLQKHIKKLIPIQDINCIRYLETAKKHCILCNKLIDNDNHIEDSEHKDRLKNAILTDYENVEHETEVIKTEEIKEDVRNRKKIAVKKEKIFNSLVEMYVNDCDINSDESESYEKENEEYIASEYESSEEIDDNTKDVVLSKEQETTDNHLKVLNARTTKSHVLKFLDGKYYLIETKDGVQIKVERNNYHGFKKIGKRKYVCQLCSSFCQRKGNHILTEKHLKNISNMIGYHCIREVDTSITHCILCNELIESYLLHTMCNEKHIELLKNSIIHSDDPDVNEIKSKISIDNTIHENEPNKSDGSHKTVDVGNLKLQANEVKDKLPSQNPVNLKEIVNTNLPQLNKTNEINESKELKNVPTNVSTNKNSELIVSDTTSVKHPDLFMIKTINQETSCYFCDVPIPNTTRNVNEHLDGSKHKQTVKDILNNNGLLVKNGYIHCKYCDNNMIREYQYYHIQLESHKENINANKNIINAKESNIDNKITSKDIEINKTKDSIQEINDDTTVKEIEFPSIMEKTPRGNEISCKICNVIVPLRNSNIQDHLEGNRHKKNLIEFLDGNKIIVKDSRNFCEICSFNILDNMNYEHIMTYFHMKKLEIHENENKNDNDAKFKSMKILFTYILNILESGNLLCTVCNVIIPNKESNITEHINGKKHISIEREVFKKNKLIIKDVNSYCEICSLYIYKGLEHGHIKTKFHEENITRKSVKTDNIDQIPQSTDITEHIGIVQSTPHVVRCTFCNVDVPDSVHTLNMHVQGTKHKSKLKTLFPNQ